MKQNPEIHFLHATSINFIKLISINIPEITELKLRRELVE